MRIRRKVRLPGEARTTFTETTKPAKIASAGCAVADLSSGGLTKFRIDIIDAFRFQEVRTYSDEAIPRLQLFGVMQRDQEAWKLLRILHDRYKRPSAMALAGPVIDFYAHGRTWFCNYIEYDNETLLVETTTLGSWSSASTVVGHTESYNMYFEADSFEVQDFRG